jgi:hypothetical protein
VFRSDRPDTLVEIVVQITQVQTIHALGANVLQKANVWIEAETTSPIVFILSQRPGFCQRKTGNSPKRPAADAARPTAAVLNRQKTARTPR